MSWLSSGGGRKWLVRWSSSDTVKGRAVVRTLTESGMPREAIVVIDTSEDAVAEANAAGLVAVAGDGTRRGVLNQALAGTASQVVIAVSRDDTAVLITLTARQLNPDVAIVAAVRERENLPLLRQSGADRVVLSSDAAGQMLAISALRPAAGQVIADLLDHGRGLDLVERPAFGGGGRRPGPRRGGNGHRRDPARPGAGARRPGGRHADRG